MKKTLTFGLLLITLTGVTITTAVFTYANNQKLGVEGNEDKTPITDYYSQISEENLYIRGKSILEVDSDLSNIEKLENNSSIIIIGKVLSVDGATNYEENTQTYHYISTYGTIQVKGIIKRDSNIAVNDVIPFSRMGGAITVEQYEKELTPRQIIRQGISELTDDEKKSLYVERYIENDIKIEAGKTYLMYLDFSTTNNKYRIIGLQYGLREYNQENNTVKNNKTNEYELLKYSVQ